MVTLLSADPRPLREFFDEAGYTHEQFRRNPTLRDLPSRRLGNLPVLLDRTSKPTVLNTLVRWFFLGLPLESRSYDGLVPPAIVSFMLDCGLLVRDGDRLAPAVMLTPCDGFLFAADPASRLESPQASDMVLWPNPSTRLLQMFTIRRPAGTTLDLGAGCGIQGILAAAHSRQVVATDLNPRATSFAAFNAWLNGVRNIECLTGDTFEPVAGRAFDLITANPPFFVTPSSDQMYCENSMELDDYCRRLVGEAPRHLAENGYLQMTFEWVQVRGQAWQDRLAGWLENTGCDGWVLRSYARDAASYAEERIGRMMPWSQEAAATRFDEWMAYYRARHVEEVHGGILAMRRREGRNWVRIEEAVSLDLTEPFGDAVLELFASQDVLETDRTREQMLRWKPKLAPEVRLEQQLHVAGGQWVPEAAKLVRPTGLPASLALEPEVADFLKECDGSRALCELSQQLAGRVKVDLEQVEEQCCAVVRKLVERRLVLL
ncbi:MAG: methyltransferase [Acidobacteriia bacterium]|nr:methyltransferase [Terriglobia bacterium]